MSTRNEPKNVSTYYKINSINTCSKNLQDNNFNKKLNNLIKNKEQYIKGNNNNLRTLSINIGGKLLERLKYILKVSDELKIDMLILSEIKINKRKLDLISKICKGWTVNLANKNNNNKGGVALIYRNSLKTFIKKIKIIDELNAIECKVSFKEKFKIIGLYATSRNKNKENYWNKWLKFFQNKGIRNTIMSGDFNIQINKDLDNLSKEKKNSIKVKAFNNLLELGFIDIWRDRNKETKDYTFRRISKNKEKMTRIDFTLVDNKELIDNIWILEELNEISPDHRGILTDIKVNEELGKIIQTSYDVEQYSRRKINTENMSRKNVDLFNNKLLELNKEVEISNDIDKYYNSFEEKFEKIIEECFGFNKYIKRSNKTDPISDKIIKINRKFKKIKKK